MDIRQDLESTRDNIELALKLARQGGATAEVAVYQDEGLGVSVRKGELDTVEFTRNHGFGITVYRNKSKGSASTSDFSEQAIRQAVKAALDIARYTAPDEFAGLAEAEHMASEIPDLDLHHPWSLTPEHAIELAQQCEQAGLAHSGISNSDGAHVGSIESVRGYGNSHGLIVTYPQTRHALSCALIAGEGDKMERSGWSESSRVANNLPQAATVGVKAAQRALRKLDSRSVPTGEFPVLYAAEIAGGLLGHLISAVSGGNLYRHSSFLEGSLGHSLFPGWMNIYEQPRLLQGVASAPVDGDGLPTIAKHFVEQGKLVSYVLGSYSARKLNMPSSANAGGVRNLRCDSTHSLKELMQEMGTGFLVTDLMGQGVNIVTGHYSRGAAGFWVENGEIQFPVSGVTIAGNLKDMFNSLRGIGDDVDRRGNVQVGSILVNAMKVAGQ